MIIRYRRFLNSARTRASTLQAIVSIHFKVSSSLCERIFISGFFSVLEECCSQGFTVNNFKTRSLPACVRHKRHRSVPNDSANDLYDKVSFIQLFSLTYLFAISNIFLSQVNFSKKRKNRMRNDEAAIIALSKSRSQFFNKDTDTLVDNEAVIVYDERTAL